MIAWLKLRDFLFFIFIFDRVMYQESLVFRMVLSNSWLTKNSRKVTAGTLKYQSNKNW